jgi:BirA family biotin operon repressor/biotin-[acetyl-CoA-carboxylase] ligase
VSALHEPEGDPREGEPLTHWEGEPVRVWESLWEVPRFEAWDRIGSTNDRLRELAAAGAPAFSVVIAELQTAGRGRAGRRWDSPASQGLWMSLLLRPPAADAARLAPILVGLAACRAFERVAPSLSARLKWPNDVLLGDRKAAGVLCEAAADGAVIAGVGVNVRQRLVDFPAELRARAVSLEMVTGRALARSELAGALVREARALLARAPLRLDGNVAEEVARRDALAGKEVRIEGGPSGVARGIDGVGRLRVEVSPGQVQPVVAGTVTLMTAAPADPGGPLLR